MAGAVAGALGLFRDQLAGQRVAIMISGANIDFETVSGHLHNPRFASRTGTEMNDVPWGSKIRQGKWCPGPESNRHGREAEGFSYQLLLS